MSEKITVKPALNLRVVDPVTRKPLPPEGVEVERTTYWLRRLREGDVTQLRKTVTDDQKTVPAASTTPAVKSASKTK